MVGELAAGAAAPTTPLGAGEAIRIMTGAPVPAGADAVVMVEDTERLDGGARVRVRTVPTAGDAVRPAGDDVATGDGGRSAPARSSRRPSPACWPASTPPP